jgi:hypothetical protein
MASFYNAETSEPISVLYVSSSGNGNVVLRSPPAGLGMRKPEVIVSGCQGTAEPALLLNAPTGDSRWRFTGLKPGASIVARDSKSNILAEIPVKRLDKAGSYKWIMTRFNSRGMKIDLDCHIDYVCYASDILGEGISFRPKSAAEFKTAITDTQLFHHDDRSDFFGKKAASATIGEGYREVSTPSLHVAISSEISSVHIDSYAFQFHAPDGDIIIDPDAGQHIVDELWFRLPMTWLRRKNMPFLASVLQALHPVLPNSVNGYVPRLGIRVKLGGTPGRDLRSGVPRFSFEATVDFTLTTTQRLRSAATLRLLSGGDPDRSPDWVLSLQAQHACRDILCRDQQQSVGLYFTAGGR